MSYRDQYDYGDEYDYEQRRRQGSPEDEGFFDRVRGRFRERMDNMDRARNQDYRRDRQDYGNYRDQSRGYSSRSNRDFGRDYGYSRNNPEWERTRQWRRNYSGDQESQGGYVDRYGQSQQQYDSGWGSGEDYEYGLGRNPYQGQDYRRDYRNETYRRYDRGNRSGYDQNFDYGSRYGDRRNRGRGYGWDQTDNESGDYHRDYASSSRNSGYRGRRQTGYSRDYGPDYGEYSNLGPNRGAYPSAGMGADYSGRKDYDYNEEYDDDVNYGEGDVGYDSEGAFYQDLDEPINYETQDYQVGSGQFSGMGPQGYQRSDERITDDVCERLTRHGRVDASNIEIVVNHGEVFLRGSVPDRQMKRMAEDVAEDISGVKDVHNEIKVEHQDQRREDRWETRAETSPAGQSNVGAGLTSAGATSLSGLEAADQVEENRHGVREGMEVIGSGGRVVGRVKEIRENDFLVDREMTRDVYVPFSAIASVGEQILLNVSANDVDSQGWEKPAVI